MKKNLCNVLFITILMTILLFPLSTKAQCNHQWSEWEVIETPTCGDTGLKIRYCLECGEYEDKNIPATGQHDWDDWYTAKNATVFKNGIKKRICYECYKTQSKKTRKLKPFVKFSKKTFKITKSKTYPLKIKYAKGDSVKKWRSSNKRIVTVSSKGKIKAKNTGTAKITVTMKSGKKAACTIKVSAKKKSSSSKKKSSKKSSGGTVYWTPGGSVYHSTKDCPSLGRSRTIYSGPKSKCPKNRGCKICY